MKRHYIKPITEWYHITQQELLAGSGPNPDSVSNPTVVSGSRRFDTGNLWNDDEEDY